MIEAMARGLPCIGSDTAGIPELLPPEDRVPPGDVDALARKIVALLDDPKRMRQASRRNLEVSQDYARRTLAPRREAFYAELRRICCPER
jgi:glycosyltransferase involved in cell wall biosynthesis